ncbi:hypothetical protein KEH51_23435 [[Brevibacterium] frigoritolerans]|uniref:Uncharacterized protein n=1 Tax=Peribacillus frigoritolerans TaxID=450367 RepID=A0A941FQN2_9BACI|nr:hypothetical protein [Peribacillus frigoritolerans]
MYFILQNFDEVLSVLENNKENLGIEFIKGRTINQFTGDGKNSNHLMVLNKDGEHDYSHGSIYEQYDAKFIGTCIPLLLNHEAKSYFHLEERLSEWINYIVQKKKLCIWKIC